MDLRAIGMGLAFALIWSSAFTSARIIVTAAPPLAALTLRFAISGLIGIALAYALGQRARLTGRQWRGVVIFGICQNGLYLGLNFVAMQWVPASLAAIIASSMPLMVALLGWLAYGQRLRPLAVAGLVAGMAGVALIMSARIGGEVGWGGIALCLTGALALAVATLAVTTAVSRDDMLMVVGLQMLVGAAVLLLPALALEKIEIIWSWQLIAAFVYTVFAPGLLATWIWFKLVERIGSVRAATFHFLNPFFGVAVAALLLGEALSWRDAVGVAIIAAGILAVQLTRRTKA